MGCVGGAHALPAVPWNILVLRRSEFPVSYCLLGTYLDRSALRQCIITSGQALVG